ncbi:hypothetical protein GCM10025863_26250 [Microbacterium suwonense]|uniref:Uncharacterized protein n=1 Tax=Microbacterium suwonense TaxID=683047 RepID=A0ABM8FWA1_9MICO|nr:hypothetical protein GCM10025863_26250 [Microbacterium suwonense]
MAHTSSTAGMAKASSRLSSTMKRLISAETMMVRLVAIFAMPLARLRRPGAWKSGVRASVRGLNEFATIANRNMHTIRAPKEPANGISRKKRAATGAPITR